MVAMHTVKSKNVMTGKYHNKGTKTSYEVSNVNGSSDDEDCWQGKDNHTNVCGDYRGSASSYSVVW